MSGKKEQLHLLQNSRTKKLFLSHLINFHVYDTVLCHGKQHYENCHVYCMPGIHLLFIHRKMFPGMFCKAHNLLSFSLLDVSLGLHTVPVSAGVCPISARPHSLWPMAITFLLIVKQSSASISLRLQQPRHHPRWALLELNIILGWSGQHMHEIMCLSSKHFVQWKMLHVCFVFWIMYEWWLNVWNKTLNIYKQHACWKHDCMRWSTRTVLSS